MNKTLLWYDIVVLLSTSKNTMKNTHMDKANISIFFSYTEVRGIPRKVLSISTDKWTFITYTPDHNYIPQHNYSNKLEALRERRPPWQRQIITLILPTVKMLSLGCERLSTPPKKGGFWIITCTTIWVCYQYYGVFLLIYSSYNTQITTKI